MATNVGGGASLSIRPWWRLLVEIGDDDAYATCGRPQGVQGGSWMTMRGVAMRWLVGYYGVFQTGHVVFNVVHLSGLRSIGDFPPPPAEGWHPQMIAFWTACALIDTAIALLALYFVAVFFGGRRRALWAGFVSLTMYMGTIFIFDYTVVATGAWARHPVEYAVLNAVTIPLVLLFAVLVRDVRALGVNA